MTKPIICLPMVAALALLPLASCKKYSGQKAAQQRQEWLSSLSDSIGCYSRQYTEDSLRLIQLREKVAKELEDFTTIDNPRQVEPYYIFTPWAKRYPLAKTGLVARIMRSEGIELIASLSQGRFERLRVSASGVSIESNTVPADQALNYTANGLTTVAFSGPSADSIAEFISENAAEKVSVEFLNPKVTATYVLPDDAKQMISRTWSLCSSQHDTHVTENQMTVASRKIEILKITLREQESK